MRKDGSAFPPALPAVLGPVVVLLGVAAMMLVTPAATRLGVRSGLVISEVFLVLPGLISLLLFGIPWAQGLRLQPVGLRTALLSLGTGAALWAASLGLLELQYSVWRPPTGYLEAFRRLHDALRPANAREAVYSLAAIAAVPAACEEILFRGIVLPSFIRSLGAVGAVSISALLFGAIHLDFTSAAPVLYRVPFAFAVAMALGALRIRTDSLSPPLLAHALLNTLTFAIAPWTHDPSQGLPNPRPLLGLALFLGGTLAAFFLFRLLHPRSLTAAAETA